MKRASAPKSAPAKRGGYDLVIVESPAKAKTINKYLGTTFKVLASYGHVRDLPRRRRSGEVIAGVNLKGWVPTYVVEDKDDRTFFDPARKIGPQVSAALLERGVIGRAMPQGDILGFAPPLCMTREEADIVVAAAAAAIKTVFA